MAVARFGLVAILATLLLVGCARKWILVEPNFRYKGTYRTVVLPEERVQALAGVIVDRNDENAAIPLALVELVSSPTDQKRITAVLTDTEGKFSIKRPPGLYWMKVSYRYKVTLILPLVVAQDAVLSSVTIPLHIE